MPLGLNWPCPGGHIFYIGLYRENMKHFSCLKPLAGFCSNLAEMILTQSSLIIVQMVKVYYISRSHRLKIDFYAPKGTLGGI